MCEVAHTRMNKYRQIKGGTGVRHGETDHSMATMAVSKIATNPLRR